MKNFKLQGALTVAASLLSFNAFSQIQFDLMHTALNCNHQGYQNTFCDGKIDQNAADEASGMVKNINAQLDRALQNPSQAKVFIAYFSFSNKKVHKKICELVKNGVSVEVVLDRGSSGNIDTLKSNDACQGVNLDGSGSKFKYSFLGGLTSQPWRLHHNKFLIVDPGSNQPVNVNFSSGNLSAFGTSLHMDHWVTMLAPKNSNLVRTYECAMKGLRETIRYTNQNGGHNGNNDFEVANVYIQARKNCNAQTGVITNIEQSVQQEGIATMFAPNDDNIVYKTLVREIEKVEQQGSNGYIYIAIQHFLHGGIGNALAEAAQAGVDVRIIMDDDVVTNKGEVQGAQQFLESLKAQAPSIKVRYMETNRNAGGNGSMMHNKFAILNGQRVLSGAGQYTTAAMRNNWENFGLTEVPNLTKKYAEYFKELWEKSVDAGYVKAQLQYNEDLNSNHTQSTIKAPPAFHPRFLQLTGN